MTITFAPLTAKEQSARSGADNGSGACPEARTSLSRSYLADHSRLVALTRTTGDPTSTQGAIA